jgi:hypothetical protein
VTPLSTGQYCVTAPGIEAVGTTAAVTVDFFNTSDPQGNASAMIAEAAGGGCFDGDFLVVTERQPVTSSTTVGPAEPANDVAFTIVIP